MMLYEGKPGGRRPENSKLGEERKGGKEVTVVNNKNRRYKTRRVISVLLSESET